MFSLCISSMAIDADAQCAAATPSLSRLAYVRNEYGATTSASTPAEVAAVVVVQDCPELISAFDRNGGPAVPTRSLRGSYASLTASPPSTTPKSLRRSINLSSATATPLVVQNIHPRCTDASAFVSSLKLRWISENDLVVFCRHQTGRWSGLTVVALDGDGAASFAAPSSGCPVWRTPNTTTSLADGHAWATHVTPAMLRRFILSGAKQGLMIPTIAEATSVLSNVELTKLDRSVLSQRCHRSDNGEQNEDDEDAIVSGIWNMEEDVVRGGVWVQLDTVLASIRFDHVGCGLFRYEVCQRIPLNDNFLTAEKGYQCPRWAAAQRLVFVLDDEYREVKAWSIQSTSAICLMNIPLPSAAVSRIFCSEDGGMLFLVCTDGLRVVSTHQLRDVLTPASNTSRKHKAGDCARVFCGDELQDEQSTHIAWDSVGRNTSTNKLSLFRPDPPHNLAGIAPHNIRRIAVVEDIISIVCVSGDALMLSPSGVVADNRNIFIEPLEKKKCGVALHVGRPPLPPHVVELTLYSGDRHAGCRAWFASTSIDRDSLLRNEIRFDVSSIAVRLCDLNEWDANHVQDTTLQIALQESPEQVYLSVEEVFIRETSAGGCSPLVATSSSSAAVYSPGRSRVGGFYADVRARPLASLQLLCRLVRVVVSRFDRCPDDINARAALRMLMNTAIRVATLILHHRASYLHHLTMVSSPATTTQPTPLDLLQEKLHKGQPIDIQHLQPPVLVEGDVDNDDDDDDSGDKDAHLAIEDVYFLSSIAHGLRVGILHVPQGVPITTASCDLPWYTKVLAEGVLPPASAGAAQRSLHRWKPKVASAVLADALPTTWTAFTRYVSELLLSTAGLGLICMNLKEILPELNPSLLNVIVATVCNHNCTSTTSSAADAARTQPSTGSAGGSPRPRPSTTAAEHLNLWKLPHLQVVAGHCVMERVEAAAAAAPSHVDDLIATSQKLLIKVYGLAQAARWWQQLYSLTAKEAIRCVALKALGGVVPPFSSTDGGAAMTAIHPDAMEVLSILHRVNALLPPSMQYRSSEVSLSRIVHSRMLFSHGGFVTDGKVSAMAANTSFLLLPEGGSDEDRDDDDDTEHAIAKRNHAARLSALTGAPVQLVVGPRDVKDVSVPSSAGREEAGSPISFGSLAMLKPTQPLPYVDLALAWISWSSSRNNDSLHEGGAAAQASTLFDEDNDLWTSVVFEQLLFLRRDAQEGMAPGRGTDGNKLRGIVQQLLQRGGGRGLSSLVGYCFRHHDMEAFLWLCNVLFPPASSSETASEQHQTAYVAQFNTIRCLLLATNRSIDTERQASPENAMLLHVHRVFCINALRALTHMMPSVVPIEICCGLGDATVCKAGDDAATRGMTLLSELFEVWGIRIGEMQQSMPPPSVAAAHGANALPSSDDVACAIVEHTLGTLSNTMPVAAVTMATDLLRGCSPDAWRRIDLSAMQGSSSPSQTQARLAFRALQSVFAVNHQDANVQHMFGAWLSTTAKAIAFHQQMSRGEGVDAMMHTIHDATLMEVLPALRVHHNNVGIHPLLPFLIQVLQSNDGCDPGAVDAQRRLYAAALASAEGDNNDDLIDVCAHLIRGSSYDKRLGVVASPAVDQTSQETQLLALRELLVGSARSLSSSQSSQQWQQLLHPSDSTASSELLFHGRRSSSSAPGGDVALSKAQVHAFIGRVPHQSNEAVQELVGSLGLWGCIPPVVRVAEADSDVRVDTWSLLLDGRPVSAYTHWVTQKLSLSDKRRTIAAVRAIGFQQQHHRRLDLQATIAAFLRLIDPVEFHRFLIDCNVLWRVSHDDDGSSGGGSVGGTLPASTATKMVSSLAVPWAPDVAPTHEQERAVSSLIKALERVVASPASHGATSSTNADPQDVQGKLLSLQFVRLYRGPEAAKQHFFHRIAAAHMAGGDWVWSLVLAWASGLNAEQWLNVTSEEAAATTPALLYLIKPLENTQQHSIACDTRDVSRRGGMGAAQPSSARLLSLLAATPTEQCPTEELDMHDEGGSSDDAAINTKLVGHSLHALQQTEPVVAAVELIGRSSHCLGVVTCAQRCSELLREDRTRGRHHDEEALLEVVLAVMASQDAITSTSTRGILSVDPLGSRTTPAAANSSKYGPLELAQHVLVLHEFLLDQAYGAAATTIAAIVESMQCSLSSLGSQDVAGAIEDRLCEAIQLFARQLAHLHLLPQALPTDGSDDEGNDLGNDEDGDDGHLHGNTISVTAVLLRFVLLLGHPAASTPIVLWMRAALAVLDGHPAAASASKRCKDTAAALLCCKPIHQQFVDVLGEHPPTLSVPDVMMACLNKHPKLTAECVQELSAAVEGLSIAFALEDNADNVNRQVSSPFVAAVRRLENIIFHSGLFSCPAERSILLQAGLDEAAALVPVPSLALNALAHCLLSHIMNDDLTLTLCATVVAAASALPGLSVVATTTVANCDSFIRCVEQMEDRATPLPAVLLRILLGTLAESDEAKIAAQAPAALSAPLTRSSLLPQDIVAALTPVVRHRPAMRAWLRRHFATDISVSSAALSHPTQGEVAASSSYHGEDPIGYIEDYVSTDLVDEARRLADAAEQMSSGAMTTEAVAACQAAEDALLWNCTSSVLSRCMHENGIHQMIPFLAAYPTNPFSAQHIPVTLHRLLHQSVFCLLRSHYVPLMHDISQRLFARDKQRYPTALSDFEERLGEFFFSDDADTCSLFSASPVPPPPATRQDTKSYNLFGLGEASGWLCKERIYAICSMLDQLQPLLDAHRQHRSDASTPSSLDAQGSSGSSTTAANALSNVSNLVKAFASGIVGQLNRFQSYVRLPSKSHYPRLFLEPLVMMLVHGYWILQRYYDERLAMELSKELTCVMNVCAHDGDFEQMRRIVFAVGDTSILEYVANAIPASQLVTLANSSPDFQLQPLHRSTMRIAIMSFFDRLAHSEEFIRHSRVEMTTLYANFRHFTALGDRLEHEAHHMLQAFIQQYATLHKKGILDSQKDALRRQNRMLDEIDARFLSAANFFIQDGQFERCLACIRDLHLIGVQKKSAAIKVLGLEHEQVMQAMAQQLDAPQDIIAVGYGYNITAHEDWTTVLYRQVVYRGKREMLSAYRSQAVSFPPPVRRGLAEAWKVDTTAHKDNTKKQMWQWMEEELLKPSVVGRL